MRAFASKKVQNVTFKATRFKILMESLMKLEFCGFVTTYNVETYMYNISLF